VNKNLSLIGLIVGSMAGAGVGYQAYSSICTFITRSQQQ